MSTAGSIALILLVVETLVLLIVPIALLGGMVYGLYRFRKWLVRNLPFAHNLSGLIVVKTREYADLVAEPVKRAYAYETHARASAYSAQARLLAVVERWLGRLAA